MRRKLKMVEGLFLKMCGGILYLVVAGWGLYGIMGAVRKYRAISRTALKTNITVYELHKLIEGRENMNKA
jgi:hypothetical protein